MSDLQTVQVYAIKDGRPPEVYSTDATYLDGVLIGSGNVPTGFVEVSKDVYDDAVSQQADAQEHSDERGYLEQRKALSVQRKALIAAGLSQAVARILVPDPNNDYSIDG